MERNKENPNASDGLGPPSDREPLPEQEKAPPDEDGEEALAAKTEEVKALQDKYLRLAAEFENFKRLSQRDQREYIRFANESLLKELLPIVDNLERAIKSAKETPGSDGLIQGVELILKQLLETLQKFGVRPVKSVGEVFDPSRHQAVAHVQSKGAPGNIVVEEYQKGYLLHDRILRAAMVAVADAPKPADRQGGKAARGAEQRADDTD